MAETLQARVGGKVVTVPVCWDAEKVAAARAKWPDGIVDCDQLLDEKDSLANRGEQLGFIAAARGLAGLAGIPSDKIPENMRGMGPSQLAALAQAIEDAPSKAPAIASPVNRAPRT